MKLLVPGAGQSRGDEENRKRNFRWQAMSVLFEQHPAPEILDQSSPYAVVSGLLDYYKSEAHQDEDVLVDERDILLTSSEPGCGLTIWRRRPDPLERLFPSLKNEYDDDELIHDLEPPDDDIESSPMQQRDFSAQSVDPEVAFQQLYTFRNQSAEERENHFHSSTSCRSPRLEKSSIQRILDRAVPQDYRRTRC